MPKKLKLFLYCLCFIVALSSFGQEEQVPPEVNALKELEKLGHRDLSMTSLTDEKVVILLQKMLKQSPLRDLPKEEVRQLIRERSRGSFLEGFIKRPRVLEALTVILQDPIAMPHMLGLFLRKDDLKKYFYIWLSLTILGYLVKRFYVKKKWDGANRWLVNLFISLLLTFTSLTIFYRMFHREISPTGKILIDQWRRRNIQVKT